MNILPCLNAREDARLLTAEGETLEPLENVITTGRSADIYNQYRNCIDAANDLAFCTANQLDIMDRCQKQFSKMAGISHELIKRRATKENQEKVKAFIGEVKQFLNYKYTDDFSTAQSKVLTLIEKYDYWLYENGIFK